MTSIAVPPTSTVRLIRLDGGGRPILIASEEVVDILDGSCILTKASGTSIGSAHHETGPIPCYLLSSLLGRESQTDLAGGDVVFITTQGRNWAIQLDGPHRVEEVDLSRILSLPASVAWGGIPLVGLIAPSEGNDPGAYGWLVSAERLDPAAPPLEADDSSPAEASEKVSTKTTRHAQLVAFSVAEFQMSGQEPPAVGLSISQVVEVIDAGPIIPIPKAATTLLGLTRWRGRLIPVVDLAGYLGLQSEADVGLSRLVVVRGDDLLAFPIQPGILRIRFPTEGAACELPAPIVPDRIRGAFAVGSTIIVIPELGGVLASA